MATHPSDPEPEPDRDPTGNAAAEATRRRFLAGLGIGGIVSGAVWSVPQILSVSSSAVAAQTVGTGCGPPPDMSFTATGGNGWASSSGGQGSWVGGQVGFVSAYRGLAPAHVVSADSVNGAADRVATKTISLEGGCTYRFTFDFAAFVGNQQYQTLQAQLAPAGTGGFVDRAVVDTRNSGTTGTRTFDFTPSSTGSYVFRYVHRVLQTRPPAGRAGDDIGVSFPTVAVV